MLSKMLSTCYSLKQTVISPMMSGRVMPVPCFSCFVHLCLLLCLPVFFSLVFLCGDCCPVVVVLPSVLQCGLAPRDIEEMLEVGYKVT